MLTSLADGADLLLTGIPYQEVAANVAEYYDIPLAALQTSRCGSTASFRLPFLPAPLVRSAMTVPSGCIGA